MADNRSLGGMTSLIKFDNSDIISKIPDKKRQREENQNQRENQDEFNEQIEKHEEYVDRSAQLNASLNSLAMMNIAKVNIRKQDLKPAKKSNGNIFANS